MMERDYNQDEIDTIIETLINVHGGSLKQEEARFLDQLRSQSSISFEQRDILIAMHDRMIGEGD